jgi:hypothetical protein
MIVRKTGVHTSPVDIYSSDKDIIQEKIITYAPIFLTQMGKYFSERSYGHQVKEVLYREFCLKDGYEGKVLYYGLKKKIVDCAIVQDYQSVLAMSNKEYGKYLAKLYIDRSNQFTELKIKDFDIGKYVGDLKDFFKQNMLL